MGPRRLTGFAWFATDRLAIILPLTFHQPFYVDTDFCKGLTNSP